MNQQDHDTFAKMLLTVGEMYSKEVSPTMISLYFKALAKYSLQDIGRAMNLHVTNPDNGQFFPKPADIVRMLEGDTGSQGLLAWVKVRDAIGAVGPWRSVVFDDPIIHLVLTDMGGWPKVCDVSPEDEPFMAKEFERRYRAYAQHGKPQQFPAAMLGIADKQNSGKYGREQPMLIGHAEAAKTVLQLGHNETKNTAISIMKTVEQELPALPRK